MRKIMYTVKKRFYYSSYMRVSVGCSRLTGETFGYIYIHEGSKPGLWSQKGQLMLGNGFVNTSP
jgi:hypothetical protein